MKHAGIAVVVLAVGLAGCSGSEKHEARPEPSPVTASVVAVERGKVSQRVELYGTVEAGRQSAVSSRVMATVRTVHVNAGDVVRAGQVLVEIDPQTAEGQEAQARGAVAQAQAALALAERNYERYKALHEKAAASELELDMARMQFEQATGALEQGRGALGAASSVARESRVVAPFAGRVSARLVQVGDLAAPGRPLVMLESATGRRLSVAVPESVAADASLSPGADVEVRIDALGDRGLQRGRVVEMTPGADPSTHTFLAKIELEGSEVMTGLAGRASISTGEREAVSVPLAAVLRSGGLTLVALRDAEGRARTRVVSLGAELPGSRVEVLSGLAGGEQVLVGLTAPPADGAPVEEVRS